MKDGRLMSETVVEAERRWSKMKNKYTNYKKYAYYLSLGNCKAWWKDKLLQGSKIDW